MSKKYLQKQIIIKLHQLQKLLKKIDEAHMVNPDDSETWDSDTLYNLEENLAETLKLLQDKKSKQLDEFGEPIILEPGLCSLIDEFQEDD